MNNICTSASEMDLLPVSRGRCIYRTDEKAIYMDNDTERIKMSSNYEAEVVTSGDLHDFLSDGEWIIQNYGSTFHVANCPSACSCGRLIVKRIDVPLSIETNPATIVLQRFIGTDLKVYECSYTHDRGGNVWTDWAEVITWEDSVIPILNGGTGATTRGEAVNNLAFHNQTTPVQLYMLRSPGVYYIDAGSVDSASGVGIPAGYNGWLVVLPNDGTYIKQFWLRRGTQNLNDYQTWVRDIVNNNVSDWKRYAMYDEIDTMTIKTGTLTETSKSFAIPEECNRIQVFVCSPDGTSLNTFYNITRLFANIATIVSTGGALFNSENEQLTYEISSTTFTLSKSGTQSTDWNYRIEFLAG